MNDTNHSKIKLLGRKEAALYINSEHGIKLSHLTLEKWASEGRVKLSYAKFGRNVYYTSADIDSFVQSRMSRKFTSTSDEAWGVQR